nr:transmembrane protein 256 isoform X2 [Taeniopygia guttata]
MRGAGRRKRRAEAEAEAEAEAGPAAMAALWGRVGALSGAAAVAAAAYGAHGMRRSDRDEYQKEAGALLLGGVGLFCAPLYRQGLTGDPAGAAAAPLGGSLLILGWAAMAL